MVKNWSICFLLLFSFLLLEGKEVNNRIDRAAQEAVERYKSLSSLGILERKKGEYEIIKDLASKQATGLAHGRTLKIRLKNGLTAYLIHEPSLTEAAAALSVEVGSWDDPKEYPGLAHFVEHLLFLGTKAYPKEIDYSHYIMERGGECNAFTAHDRTVYGFCIQQNGLSGALDRLSHFFIEPTFSDSAIQREAHAVDHEFEDAIENDSVRAWRVLKETGNSLHPNAIFSCGNLASLSSLTSADVKKWFCANYTPSSMHFVLISSLPLKQQADLVSKCFSRIPVGKHDEVKRRCEGSLLSEKQKGHYVYIAPSYKNRSLLLLWEVPKEFLTPQNIKGMTLLRMALEYEDDTSLRNALIQRGLAKEVHVDFWHIEKEHALFMFDIGLTKEGLSQIDSVILTCNQALNGIKQEALPEYLFAELVNNEKAHKGSCSAHNMFDAAMQMASELINESIHTYPEQTKVPHKNALTSAQNLLAHLNPENCVYVVLASPEETGVHMSMVEKWMGSKYIIRDIPKETLDLWSSASADPRITPPSLNYFQRSNAHTSATNIETDEDALVEPLYIREDAFSRIRLIEEETDGDEIYAFFCFRAPSFASNLKGAAMQMLFMHGLEEKIKELFPAQNEIYWNLDSDGEDLCLFLSVNRARADVLFPEFFTILKQNRLSEEEFINLKEQALDNYIGDPEPLEYAHQILDSLLQPSMYTRMEIHQVLPSLSYSEFLQFQNGYFSEIYVEGAFFGNINQQKAIEIWELIEKKLEATPYHLKDKVDKLFCFSAMEHAAFIMHKTHRQGSALVLILEVGEASSENWARQKIITALLQQDFFDELRTKQQTAYKLYNWNEVINHSICQCFAMQSSTHHPLDLLSRVESFLENLCSPNQTTLTLERFERIKMMILSSQQKQLQYLEGEEEINSALKNIEEMRRITYDSVQEAIVEAFSNMNRKRIAILVEGKEKSYPEDQSDAIRYFPAEKEKFYR